MSNLTIEDINKYNADGSRIPLYPLRLAKKAGEQYVVRKQIPEKWELSDFSPTENLIEITDLSDGERFWVDPKEFFVQPFKVGFRIRILLDIPREIIDVELKEFGSLTFRGKQYLTAVFELMPVEEVKL